MLFDGIFFCEPFTYEGSGIPVAEQGNVTGLPILYITSFDGALVMSGGIRTEKQAIRLTKPFIAHFIKV